MIWFLSITIFLLWLSSMILMRILLIDEGYGELSVANLFKLVFAPVIAIYAVIMSLPTLFKIKKKK